MVDNKHVLFIHTDNEEDEPLLELPRKEATTKKKPYGYCPTNGKLLDDVIAELDESNREPTYVNPSSDADVCNLYLEDLVKIQQQLSVEEQHDVVSNNAQETSSMTTSAVGKDLKHVTPFASYSKGPPMVPSEDENIDFLMGSSPNNATTYLDCMKPLLSAMSLPNPHNSQQQQPTFPMNNIYPNIFSVQRQSNPSNTSQQRPSSSSDADVIMSYVNEINEMVFSNDLDNQHGGVESTSDVSNIGFKRSFAEASLDPVVFPDESPSKGNSSMGNVNSSLVEADSTTSDSDETDTSSKLTNSLDKKTARKTKNNAASRVHRAKKKKKFEGLFQQKEELEKRNAELRIQAETMQKEANFLRELLLVKVAASSKT